MLKLHSKFIVISVVFSCLIFAPTNLKGQQMSAMELERANKSADQFIEEFRKTLDFGSAYKKFFVKNSIQVLKKYGFFKSINLNPKLISKLSNATLKRVYSDEMNLYYLMAIYELARNTDDGDDSSQPHILARDEAFKHNPLVSDNALIINTKSELSKYLKELNIVVSLYRKQLSQDMFNSEQYNERVKQVNNFRKILPSVSTARVELGIKKNTKVYTLQKDIFVFYFVEEKEQLKVLILLIEG